MDQKKQKKQKQVTAEEYEKIVAEKEDFKQKYLRALADYHNFEKRSHEQREDQAKQAAAEIIIKLLSIMDNLEKAEVFVKDAGLKIIKDQFSQILKSEGVEKLEVLGKEFDPREAEAISIAPGDKDNMIVEVVQPGYKLYNSIIRPAQVKVSKKAESVKGEA